MTHPPGALGCVDALANSQSHFNEEVFFVFNVGGVTFWTGHYVTFYSV